MSKNLFASFSIISIFLIAGCSKELKGDLIVMNTSVINVMDGPLLMMNFLVAPIEDEVNVDKRHASVRLEPLEEYVRRWNIDYKLPDK